MLRTAVAALFFALLFLPLVVSDTPLLACINDRDTLAEEARNLQTEGAGNEFVIRAISGRFERNPTLYYEMRLKRVAEELQANPKKLELYDDAAVACDRVGRSSEAIQWIEKKHQQLEKLNARDKTIREHWYRYYANVGTFWAHRWIRAGADRSAIGEMKQARDYIKQAIAIKPNAHFGREKYQLKAMQWIIDPPTMPAQGVMPDILGLGKFSDQATMSETSRLASAGHPDAIKGLSGLIILGNAWESVDIFYALSAALLMDKKNSLAYLAQLRVNELIDNGRNSILPTAPAGSALKQQLLMISSRPDSPQEMKSIYHRLRADAEDYQKRRTEYMMQRLQAGRHPDTDPTFWNDWHDPGPPPLRPLSFWKNLWHEKGRAFLVIGAALLLSLGTLRFARARRIHKPYPA